MSSQIFGAAVVSPPVFELSGNSAGILAAASSNVAKAFCVVGKSKGASPLTIFAKLPAACPLDFISAFLAAIGSCWLETAVVPKARITSAAKVETNFIQSSLQAFSSLRQTPVTRPYYCANRGPARHHITNLWSQYPQSNLGFWAVLIASQTRRGVAGMSTCRTR